jgi:hypothetical protein
MIHGNTLSDDGLPGKQFDYMLSNPPFGVEWKKIKKEIVKEHDSEGFNGRFGPGLPRVSDGSLLFLMHLISKMRLAKDGGSRFGIVLGTNFASIIAVDARLAGLSASFPKANHSTSFRVSPALGAVRRSQIRWRD